MLAGDVPYRDFWTMYAPGSFVTLAGAFSLFGRELIVSNVLGILTSATAVAVFFRLAKSVAGAGAAACLAGLVALAFYGTSYHSGFTSYPPVLLLILGAVSVVAARCVAPGWTWAILPGAILGLAALYKHDIVGYAAIATGVALLIVRVHTGAAPVWRPVLALAISSATVPLAAAWWLVAHGAGPDLWDNLIRFPLVDFGHVRGETFPFIPRSVARRPTWWCSCGTGPIATCQVWESDWDCGECGGDGRTPPRGYASWWCSLQARSASTG